VFVDLPHRRKLISSEMNALGAMSALDDTDRTAVLLRQLENYSRREVRAVLGASEGAAQGAPAGD
jgi:DNA-directed RNA polymerase specialized sigma24 family protein